MFIHHSLSVLATIRNQNKCCRNNEFGCIVKYMHCWIYQFFNVIIFQTKCVVQRVNNTES